jgi:hypothetical protein
MAVAAYIAFPPLKAEEARAAGILKRGSDCIILSDNVDDAIFEAPLYKAARSETTFTLLKMTMTKQQVVNLWSKGLLDWYLAKQAWRIYADLPLTEFFDFEWYTITIAPLGIENWAERALTPFHEVCYESICDDCQAGPITTWNTSYNKYCANCWHKTLEEKSRYFDGGASEASSGVSGSNRLACTLVGSSAGLELLLGCSKALAADITNTGIVKASFFGSQSNYAPYTFTIKDGVMKALEAESEACMAAASSETTWLVLRMTLAVEEAVDYLKQGLLKRTAGRIPYMRVYKDLELSTHHGEWSQVSIGAIGVDLWADLALSPSYTLHGFGVCGECARIGGPTWAQKDIKELEYCAKCWHRFLVQDSAKTDMGT